MPSLSQALRVELLALAKPGNSMPDTGIWVQRARELEAYVVEGGQPETAPDLPPLAASSGKPSVASPAAPVKSNDRSKAR